MDVDAGMSGGDILAAIDAAVGCQQCGGPLGDSPSDDFCRDVCQAAWHAANVDRLDGYREPWDRPWDFPGIGTDAHSTDGLVADLVIFDEVHFWRPALQALAEAFSQVATTWTTNITTIVGPSLQHLADLAPRPAEQPDPRQAALDARRARNTGPPNRGRPPRTIGRPTTARR